MPDESLPALTLAEVRHLAALARVGATEEELERMRAQLASILANFRVLQEVDTTGVEPTGHAIAVENVMRGDEPHPSHPREETLANAPQAQEGFVRVRRVLED
ncbi:MAG: Asp-tRNA(Asn)/Glu-tRNA(Gln) amidotransferase subunit GatC [Chloroflexi bacterium]|nr:Asp-tRNA(Asn)/Glu-tRNA(Gln) amidotransferase subunit GatC [Chloroflexota bacterium]